MKKFLLMLALVLAAGCSGYEECTCWNNGLVRTHGDNNLQECMKLCRQFGV